MRVLSESAPDVLQGGFQDRSFDSLIRRCILTPAVRVSAMSKSPAPAQQLRLVCATCLVFEGTTCKVHLKYQILIIQIAAAAIIRESAKASEDAKTRQAE